ncbi:exosortase B [Piscinibacter sp. XHJ-5]|uniref:exosortase B n=1 Tax=Piscinibacter sp. XHJ-5 TaxID=3037797 RepID=UPI002452EFA6|nr:exosortase B [Piscinibacter sp. XHJ-5]
MDTSSRTLPDGIAASGARTDRLLLGAVLAALAVAYGPTYWDFTVGRAAADAQGHELLVLAIAGWLFWRQRATLVALPDAARVVPAGLLLAFGALLYVFGRSHQVLRMELVSQVLVVAALLVGWKGWAALRAAWFPLFFLMFVIPLPYTLVATLTGPLKSGVSAVTTHLLHAVGYPIGRSGVIITIGQYELLVSTACAGLQTMFTLEALGLVYVNLKGYRSALRNTLLALLIVPVSFCANVVRVVVLALVTYHLGDDVGRGFFHGFAGLVLFMAALVFIMAVDRALSWILPKRFSQ